MMAFPLLRLPVEIRTSIYKLVCIVEEPIKITKRYRTPVHQSTTRSGKSLRIKTDKAYRNASSGRSALALTASCRQVYLESISLYYAGNTFECLSQHAFSDFLNDIGTTNRQLVPNIRMAASNFRYLRQLTGVKSLLITVKDFASAYHLPCCVPGALQDFSEICMTLDAVEVLFYLQDDGTMRKQSIIWNKGKAPDMDAFLEHLSRLYTQWSSPFCTLWSA